ncbi:hypothetical protein PTKIN_Ptkin06aG0132500 [Pterospermum kingtungense]
MCHHQLLQVLDLSHNNLSGTIPSCINNLTAMARFTSLEARISSVYSYYDQDFFSNLNGSYDDHLAVIWKGVEQQYGNTLGLLKNIDLSNNKLSGEVPAAIASLQGFITLNLSKKHVERKHH